MFYRDGWRGINVDSLRGNIDLFKSKRSEDVNVCGGIGTSSQMRKLYIMEPETLSTFDEAVAEKYAKLGHTIRNTDEVPFYSVTDFISMFGIVDDIALMSIDIEGNEFDVVRGFVENDIRPNIIICETVEYSPQLTKAKKNDGLIADIGNLRYHLYADTFVNSIFVSERFWMS